MKWLVVLSSRSPKAGSCMILCVGMAVLTSPQKGQCETLAPLVGKTVAAMPAVSPNEGEALETPNQKRQRLGQPIVAAYPAPDYGTLSETPNQRRQRLGETPSRFIAPGR